MPPLLLSRRALLATLAAVPLAASATPGQRPAPPRVIPEPLLQLAGTCVISGWSGHAIPAELRSLLRLGALGGVLVNRNNFGTRAELAALCAQLTALAPATARPLISADEEGGPVAHLSPPLPSFPSMPTLGTIDDVALTERVGLALGTELSSVGVNFDFAPVLDVRTSPQNTVDLGRTFSRDANKVARHGEALIRGLGRAGVLACAKHFPGHGAAAMDSHAGLPRVPHDLAALDAVDLVPFRACQHATPAVMLAHVVYEGIDRAQPASLSRPVIDGVLRQHLGFDGVAVSDDLQMRAIRARYGVEQACEVSMRAGCDLLLVAHTSGFAARAVRHLATVAMDDPTLHARLTEAAGRIQRMRARLGAGSGAAAQSGGGEGGGSGGSGSGSGSGTTSAVDAGAVLREVAQRSGAHRARGVDPTLRR